jgi:hypothetical protein
MRPRKILRSGLKLPHNRIQKMSARITVGVTFLLTLISAAAGQKLPSKIDGYKVYHADVVVTDKAIEMPAGVEVLVRLDEPKLTSVGFSGATVGVTGQISSIRSGQVDRVMFRDFHINGVPVDVESVGKTFAVKTGGAQPVDLSVKVNLGPAALAKAGYREVSDPKTDWQVTGTLLVFGRFDRLGFTFKRVIPVKLSIMVKNPLRSR